MLIIVREKENESLFGGIGNKFLITCCNWNAIASCLFSGIFSNDYSQPFNTIKTSFNQNYLYFGMRLFKSKNFNECI